MASDFLSQDEVDSLLRGVTGESDDDKKSDDAPGGVRSYNLATQERIVRGRMPTMEVVNERFARLFRINLFNFIRRTPEISVGQVRVLKFSEFIRNLPVPANFNLVQAKPLRGNGLIIFDPNLVFQVVDNMFGGDGSIHTRVEGREFTQTEMRIIQKLLGVVFESYEKSWESVYKLKFEFVRSEMNPQFVNIATPNEVVVATTFEVEFGGSGGPIHFCFPYAMIEPIRELLYSSMQGDHLIADKRWLHMLSKQIQSADVELKAMLGHSRITLGQVLKMQAGDVISLEVDESIQAMVGEVPVMECKYGVFNGQYALRVEKMLTGTSGDSNGEQS
ncbi:Flagellar motor switch protein FliM [Ferriphaselus amnicola]|jgi:flagellar motor switch protein FliM|uniref:Flagellar motor switch protein FliM n=1 Tax=Ferriphaselus amnicola TaxID=1188319 RepID=A0A2Z6GDL4_9PROT|nr:flagellar motor switch protein FliM [Ferriphaselus amnicola]BBE51530.1 Flagellar motor switch protein FliM [Ferriphaselus amnicola]